MAAGMRAVESGDGLVVVFVCCQFECLGKSRFCETRVRAVIGCDEHPIGLELTSNSS